MAGPAGGSWRLAEAGSPAAGVRRRRQGERWPASGGGGGSGRRGWGLGFVQGMLGGGGGVGGEMGGAKPSTDHCRFPCQPPLAAAAVRRYWPPPAAAHKILTADLPFSVLSFLPLTSSSQLIDLRPVDLAEIGSRRTAEKKGRGGERKKRKKKERKEGRWGQRATARGGEQRRWEYGGRQRTGGGGGDRWSVVI
ncbi:hypothetical protein Syun_031641 [Stephania yunnanensis]|uniref:Uncharacterized protein n=1 Tax=Stephania yunnanensis TaxID=152371 RepID=A0AAP0DZS9_9MAGN